MIFHANSLPINAGDYLEPGKDAELDHFGPPIQFTYAQAFEYVINQINHQFSKFGMARFDSLQQPLFVALTNLEVENPPRGVSSHYSSNYVSWFVLICHTLEKEGYIRECSKLPSGGYLIR